MKNKSGNDKTSLANVTKDIIYRGSRNARCVLKNIIGDDELLLNFGAKFQRKL